MILLNDYQEYFRLVNDESEIPTFFPLDVEEVDRKISNLTIEQFPFMRLEEPQGRFIGEPDDTARPQDIKKAAFTVQTKVSVKSETSPILIEAKTLCFKMGMRFIKRLIDASVGYNCEEGNAHLEFDFNSLRYVPLKREFDYCVGYWFEIDYRSDLDWDLIFE